MPSPTFLTLAQFAALAAQIDAGLPKDRVLQEADVSQEVWERAQLTWLSSIAQQVGRQRLALHQRYTELFEEHRKKALERIRLERRTPKGEMPSPPQKPVVPSFVVPEASAKTPPPAMEPKPPQAPFTPLPAQPLQAPFTSAQVQAKLQPGPLPSAQMQPKPQPAPVIASVPLKPKLTLEQLATFRAEMMISPGSVAEIRKRYGLDELTHQQEDLLWKQRFAGDKGLLENYIKLFQYYRAVMAPS